MTHRRTPPDGYNRLVCYDALLSISLSLHLSSSFLYMVSEPLLDISPRQMANETLSMAIACPGVNNVFPSTGSTIGLNVLIKLTRDNFLLWKTQLFPFLNCNDLAYILTQDPPISTAANSADNVTENPVYQAWRKKDQQVLSILVSSLSEEILPCIVGKTTSKEAWEALNKHCSSSNPSRIMHLHNRLHNSSKGTRSVPECVQDIRRTCDELAVVGYPVQESVSIYARLRGLGPTYSAFNARITSNLHNLTFEDVVAQFNSHDELLSFTNPPKENIAL